MNTVFVLCIPNYEYECSGINVIGIYQSREMAEAEEARITELYRRYQLRYHSIRTQFPNRLIDGLSGAEGEIAIQKHKEEWAIIRKDIEVMVEEYNKELNKEGLGIGEVSLVATIEMPLIMGA